ncbi:MAG: Protein TraK [Accumulibacter sp.]|uniref:TraK family protein n=2 Tax=Accumulibacter sp. TaxID=2053492 RepID=UPI0012292C69|nr:TraK family protein [Accumulibacter sp.]MDS4056735.1 TraK family protein [Accumulibacter sp.]TLD45289.1 MAG: Protein TraK [Accumulibacter sp.]
MLKTKPDTQRLERSFKSLRQEEERQKNAYETVMTKNLSVRIAERTAQKKPSRNGQNRATFLAIRGDVKQALDDGWPVKTIWETLHEEGKVSFSYQAFRGYANRLILSSPASRATVSTPMAVDSWIGKQRNPATAQATEKSPEGPTTSGFTFNRTPKKEDLL